MKCTGVLGGLCCAFLSRVGCNALRLLSEAHGDMRVATPVGL